MHNTHINISILRENDVDRICHQDELQKKETPPYLNSFPLFSIVIFILYYH